MMDQTKEALAKRFEMKDLGILHHFLGVKVDCNLVTGEDKYGSDNQSTQKNCYTPQFHGRTKHIEIKYHFIRDEVESRNVKLEYCRSEDMIADMLTKGLPITQFVKLRQMHGWHCIPPAIVGGTLDRWYCLINTCGHYNIHY